MVWNMKINENLIWTQSAEHLHSDKHWLYISCTVTLRLTAAEWLSLSKRNFRFDLGEFLFFNSGRRKENVQFILTRTGSHKHIREAAMSCPGINQHLVLLYLKWSRKSKWTCWAATDDERSWTLTFYRHSLGELQREREDTLLITQTN